MPGPEERITVAPGRNETTKCSTATGSAAAAAGAAAAAAVAVVGVDHLGLALNFVRAHRKDPGVIALGKDWITAATRAQLFVLQQKGNTANCAVCGEGASASASLRGRRVSVGQEVHGVSEACTPIL